MNRVRALFLAWLALLLALPLHAAEPREQPTDRERARTVFIFHQPIVMLQATFGQTTPEERVLRVRNTLRAFTEADISQPLQPAWPPVYDEQQTGDAAQPGRS